MSEKAKGKLIEEYKKVSKDMLKIQFPYITDEELDRAIDWSISKRIKDVDVRIENNYKRQTINGTLLDFTNYILDKQPIITSYGVLFNRHGVVPNPLYMMIDKFIKNRDIDKGEMFKHPKGSDEYRKYNTLQLLDKLDANAIYGALGKFSCTYFNLYVSSSVTSQGRSCVSAASLLFESFLNNNVPFGSLNELITFIYNVKNQKREFEDRDVLDRNITVEETFFQLIASTGWGWIPSEDEMNIVWDLLRKLDPTTINRLFYKNNLFNFIDNNEVMKLIDYVLVTLEEPFMNPNKVPAEIKDTMDALYDLMYEYVYYDQQIIDRLEKMESLIRSVSIIMDTDSTIVSFDGWYRYIFNKTINLPMKIKKIVTPVNNITEEEKEPVEESKVVYRDYDFINDDIIEVEKELTPDKVIPQEGVRYSIINIIANIVGRLILDYMIKYTENSNAIDPNRECLMIMKNEYLFKRVLQIPDAKKNYASIMELQEGHIVPDDEKLDIKGIPCFVKSTANETSRARLKEILYNDILNADEVDQVRILKDLALIEKDIYNSIQNKEKIYYKPVRIKSMNNYENPMMIQGIKASIAYNSMKSDDMEAIDLEARNSINIIKTDINMKNVDQIKDAYPEVWARTVELLARKEYANGIDAMALPANETVPDWILPFVKYYEIINDNIGLFPIEAISIFRGGKGNNYTNMIKF